MTASNCTPPNGESVSDAELPDDFEQLLIEEVDECRRLLNDTLRPGVSRRDVAVRISEVKSRLSHIDRQMPD
jgi:hypothetical protein